MTASLVLHVELVDGIELELDFFPRLHGDLQFRAGLGGIGENVLAFLLQRTALVTRLDAGLEGHAVGGGTSSVAPWMAEGTATELQHRIVAEDIDQRRHVPHVDAAGGDCKYTRHGAPILVEEDAHGAV